MAHCSFHSYYPVPETSRAISAALQRRGLQPSTARDKRCIIQWVPRSRATWKRVLRGTLLSSSFFVSQGLTHKDRLFAMLQPSSSVEAVRSTSRDESMYEDGGHANKEAERARSAIKEYVPDTYLIHTSTNRTDRAATGDAQGTHSLVDAVTEKLESLGDSASGPWVLKAAETNNALGVVIFHNAGDLMRKLEDLDNEPEPSFAGSRGSSKRVSENHVLQRYITRPFLLDSAKFHLRINVLVVGHSDNSCCEVYVHSGIVAHVSTQHFVSSSEDKFVHVTNHSVQRAHPDYDRSKHTLDLSELERRVVASRGDSWKGFGEEIFTQACKIVAGVFKVATQRPRDFRPMNSCFEVFGFDFLPMECDLVGNQDSHTPQSSAFPVKLQLLEINGGPALEGAARPDICRKVVDDVLRVVLDPWYPPRHHRQEKAKQEASRVSSRRVIADTMFARVLGRDQAYPDSGIPEREFPPPQTVSQTLISYAQAVINLVEEQEKEWDDSSPAVNPSMRDIPKGEDTPPESPAPPTQTPTPLPPSLPTPHSTVSSSKLNLKRIQMAYDDIVRNVPVSVGSAISMKERDKEGFTAPKFVYGEIPFSSMADTFERIRKKHSGLLKPGGHFLDIGSGVGKTLVAAALLHEFKSCTGIEILETLHKEAEGVLERWNSAIKSKDISFVKNIARESPWPQLRSVHGDIVAEEKRIMDGFEGGDVVNIGKMDIVFANATCFDGGLMESIAKAADRMRPGAFFVSTTNVLPSVKWEIVDTFASKGSWGSVTVYIHKRRSKRSALLHRLAHSAAGTMSRTRTTRQGSGNVLNRY